MQSILISSACSLTINLFLLLQKHTTVSSWKIQNAHHGTIQRYGGLGLLIAIYISATFFVPDIEDPSFKVIAYSFIIFLIGFYEDVYQNLSSNKRLSAIILICFFYLANNNAYITRTGIDLLDNSQIFIPFYIVFSIFALTGLVNAYNIIDGLNGLCSIIAIFSLSAISIVAFESHDFLLMHCALIIIASNCGFLILNYPCGKVFLGDGGAYLNGFLCGSLSILLVNRNPSVSPFLALVVNAYPIIETIYSIYRRKFIQASSYGAADFLHLHSLIFRCVAKSSHKPKDLTSANSIATIYICGPLLILTSLGTYFYYSSQVLLILLSFTFFAYLLLYKKLNFI